MPTGRGCQTAGSWLPGRFRPTQSAQKRLVRRGFWQQIAVMKAIKRWRVQKRNAQMALML